MELSIIIAIILLALIPNFIVRKAYNLGLRAKTKYENGSIDFSKDMLNKNGIYNINFTNTHVPLGDHYNSKLKTICLSNGDSSSVASIAIALHESGHAIQDEKGYFFLKLRAMLGTPTIIANKFIWIFIFLGFLFNAMELVYVGISFMCVVVLFDIVTLPVEINASKRAINYLESTNALSIEEMSVAKKVLYAAAFTYIAATLAGILQLIRLISISRDD